MLKECREEDEEDEEESEDAVSRSVNRRSSLFPRLSGSHRMVRNDTARLNILRPNVQEHDKLQEEDSSDEDNKVPQSFMIEAAHHRHKPSSPVSPRIGKGKERETRPLSKQSASKHPILPTAFDDTLHLSIPPRP